MEGLFASSWTGVSGGGGGCSRTMSSPSSSVVSGMTLFNASIAGRESACFSTRKGCKSAQRAAKFLSDAFLVAACSRRFVTC